MLPTLATPPTPLTPTVAAAATSDINKFAGTDDAPDVPTDIETETEAED
jgi:hypothetical protein